MSKNYRLEGLEREADGVAEYLKKNAGLVGCDLEIIGAILFTKYKGEDDRISELLEHSSKLIQEADALLEKLRNKYE